MCVENKMTNNGPMWAPHGLKFQYRTHIGPFWALCPDSAHMGPICPCLLGKYSSSLYNKAISSVWIRIDLKISKNRFMHIEKSNYGPPKYDVFLISYYLGYL